MKTPPDHHICDDHSVKIYLRSVNIYIYIYTFNPDEIIHIVLQHALLSLSSFTELIIF